MAGTAVRRHVRPRSLEEGRSFGARELFRLVNRAPDVVLRYRLRPPGFEFVSRAITRVTGFLPEELYRDPASALKIVHHDDRAIVHELLAKGTGRLPMIVRWVRKDQSIAWIEQRNTPVFTFARELVAIEGIAREILDPTLGFQSYLRVIGDLRIDLDRGRVLVAGREIRLTPSEFRLLLLLTDQPGRIVSRAMIVETLWNSSHMVGTRTSEVHISKLRSKIERHAPHQTRIETVRGSGYRFIPHGSCGPASDDADS